MLTLASLHHSLGTNTGEIMKATNDGTPVVTVAEFYLICTSLLLNPQFEQINL
jgi:hypothetical protein